VVTRSAAVRWIGEKGVDRGLPAVLEADLMAAYLDVYCGGRPSRLVVLDMHEGISEIGEQLAALRQEVADLRETVKAAKATAKKTTKKRTYTKRTTAPSASVTEE